MRFEEFRTRHFVLGAACLLALSIVATSIGSVLILRDRETEEWRRQLNTLSILLAAQTEQTMSSSMLAMDSIAERIESMGIRDDADLRARTGKEAVHHMLRDKIAGLPQVDVATVVAANGDVINFTRAFPAPPINLSDRDYFIARRGDPGLGMFISSPVKNKGNGKWVFYLSHRLNDARGGFMGLVLVGISVDQFTSFYDRLGQNLGNGAAITLYRRDFSILTRWPRQEALIGTKNLTGTSYHVVEEMKKTNDVVFTAGPRYFAGGESAARLGAVRVLERFPLIINLTVTEELFLTNWRQMMWTIALAAIACALILAAATLTLVRIARKKEQGDQLLRLNELRYRAIIEASPVPYVLSDKQQRIVYLNGAFTRTFGYTQEELQTLADWLQRAFPDPAYRHSIASNWQNRLEQALQFDAPFEPLEVRIRCKDGSTRTVIAAAAMMGTSFEGTHLLTLYDITERKLTEEALEESELKYRALAESAPLAIQIFSSDGVPLRVNQAWEKMWGVPFAALAEYNVLRDEQLAKEGLLNLLQRAFSGETISFPIHQYDRALAHDVASGPATPLWVRAFAYPVFGPGRKLLEVVVIQEDVTERMQHENHLRLSASVFKNSGEGIVITDRNNSIVDVNNAFTRITGYSRDEVLGKDPRLLKSGHHDRSFYDDMWRSIEQHDYWQGEVWNRRRDGALFAERLTISTVRGNAGEVTHRVAVMSDITEIKQNQEHLLRAAHHDGLTGIPNRTLFTDRLLQAIAQTQRSRTMLAVGYLDLDGFKPINDTYGHEAGDRVLIETAERLVLCLRGGDTVARLGGDEFVFLLVGLDAFDECEIALQRMLEAIAQPFINGSVQLNLSASIGVTLYPADNVAPDVLLRHADQAMYQAKKAGKGRYFLFKR